MHGQHASRPANERSGASAHGAHVRDEPDDRSDEPSKPDKPLHGRPERRGRSVFLAPFLIRLSAAGWAELSAGMGRPGLFRGSGRLDRSGTDRVRRALLAEALAL